MSFKKIKKQAGFTLIEILVASTIFVSVVGMGIATYSSASGFQSKSAVIRETNQALRYTMDAIVRDVRTADSSVAYSDGIENLVAKGFVFAGGVTGDPVSFADNSADIPYSEIKIYRKGTGNCKTYVEEISYKIDGNKLYQYIDYFNHTVIGDSNSPADYDAGSVLTNPNCIATSGIDILSSRVNVTQPTIPTSFFQGVAFMVGDSSGTTSESAYLDINLEVEPNGTDGATETSRIFKLETTVVPRNLY